MSDPALAGSGINKVVSPGDVVVISCPDGLQPLLKAGDMLPSAEAATFYVITVDGSGFTLGPLKSGVTELKYRCSDENEYQTSLEVPTQDPQKLPPGEGPLLPIAFDLFWIWLVMAAVILLSLLGLASYQLRKKRLQKAQAQKALAAQATKKSSNQLLRDTIAWLEQIEKAPTSPDLKVGELYQRGYRSIRGYLESELKLKTQPETTTQFLGSLRIIAPQKSLPAELLARIERSLVFSDQNRFGAALSDAPETRLAYASELKGILTALVQASVKWRAEAGQNTTPAKPSKKVRQP